MYESIVATSRLIGAPAAGGGHLGFVGRRRYLSLGRKK
jgi:hypothetical protein